MWWLATRRWQGLPRRLPSSGDLNDLRCKLLRPDFGRSYSSFVEERANLLTLFIHDQRNNVALSARTRCTPRAVQVCLVFCRRVDVDNE